MNTLVVVSCLALAGLSQAQTGCWPTGCQPSNWAVTGCGQYNMNEVSRTGCPGGFIYQCCPQGSGPAPNPPAPNPGNGGGNGGDISGITFAQFTQATTGNGYPAPSQDKYNAFIRGLPKGSISTKQEAAMALANIFQESDGLRAKVEYACGPTGASCPGSYQNPCDLPGQRYFGRGYIQLTWCYNYRDCSKDLYGDDRLLRNPSVVASDEQTAWDTAFWYWKTRVHNAPGVQQGQFGSTVRAINGGYECDGAYRDKARKRFAMYNVVRAAFGLSGKGDERGCYN